MKLKIYQETEEKETIDFALKLEPCVHTGGVDVVAVDPRTGERQFGGYLVSIRSTGIGRQTGVNPAFGFPLDERGRIELND